MKNCLKIRKVNQLIVLILIISTQSFCQTWDQIGPEGGYFKEFTFDPNNASIIYAGSDDGGGVWKSIDDGATWSLLTEEFPNMTGWFISVDENALNTIYACDVYSRYGVLKSSDGGQSWVEKTTGLQTAYDKMVSGIVIKTTDTLFISTGEASTTTPPRPGNGVFRSFDGGDSWTTSGLQGITVPCINKNTFGTIFAGTEFNGLQYSNDNGASWIVHPDVNATSVVHEIDVKDNVIVIAASTGIYLSTDWGINFTNIGLSGDFNFDIAIHSITPNIELYCPSFSGLQYYSSATSNWSIVSDPLLNNQLIMGIESNGTMIYLGAFSNSPIYKSSNGGTSWETTSSSPIVTELTDIYMDPTNSDRILTSLLGTYNIGGAYNKESIYETNDGGLTWTRKGPNAHGLSLAANPYNSDQFYLGTFSQGLFKTNDSFDNQTQLISGNKLIGDVAISKSDTNVVIVSEVDLDASQVAIKRSADGGSSFTNVGALLANRVLFNSNNNDTVYAATNNGVHLSTDNGVTWNPWILSGSNILSLAFNNNILYAGTDDGVFYKIVNSNVIDISGNWQTPVELKSIFILDEQLYVGLNGAEKDTTNVLHGSIWQSLNNGNDWTNITNQMTSTNIYGNNIITSDGNELYVGTYGGGILKSNGLSLSIEENKIINSMSLYPNPTNGNITITANNITIKSYILIDNSGRKIKEETFNQGVKSLDLSGFSSGVYSIIINDLHRKSIIIK